VIAAQTCKAYHLYKEQAYLLTKVGNEEEAIKILIENCENVSEVIEMSVKLNINDDLLWD
jgi:hypothetical protein